jgi:proteasome inhibitor subunit 1 (PI31)
LTQGSPLTITTLTITTVMSGDPLDPAVLTKRLPDLLPEAAKKLNSAQDGLAALIHTAMVELGFRLIAIDDDSPPIPDLNNILPKDWAQRGPSNYTFRYKHDQSSLEFLLKVSQLGRRTLFHAIASEACRFLRIYCHVVLIRVIQDDKIATLDISTNDFISPSFFPHEIGTAPLVHGFISSNRIEDLITRFKLKIISHILPALNKEGYVERSEAASTSERAAGPQSPPDNQPSARPRVEEPLVQDRPGPYPYNPTNPLAIGRRDLEPFPENPFSPPSLFPLNNGGGDGMFVGPDHPIFGDRRPHGGGGFRGPWGGDGFLPPMGAPPRARFDPVGPGPFPGGGRGGPPHFPGRGNMHDPDNDEFQPPVSCPFARSLRIRILTGFPLVSAVTILYTCKLATGNFTSTIEKS